MLQARAGVMITSLINFLFLIGEYISSCREMRRVSLENLFVWTDLMDSFPECKQLKDELFKMAIKFK